MAHPVLDALEGFITGLLLFLVVFYGLQTQRPYPAWLLAVFHEPWIFVVWIAVVLAIWAWSVPVALALLLVGVGLVLDIYLLGMAIPLGGTRTHIEGGADEDEFGPPVDEAVTAPHYSLFAAQP